MLVPFLIPLAARSARTLRYWGAAALLPAAVSGAVMLLPGHGGAVLWFLGCGASAALGIAARRTSLLLAGAGHPRPHSFWVEAVFLGVAALFLNALGVM